MAGVGNAEEYATSLTVVGTVLGTDDRTGIFMANQAKTRFFQVCSAHTPRNDVC
jgi:hypothetical protein